MNLCEICIHAEVSYSLSGHHLECMADMARYRREHMREYFGNTDCAYFVKDIHKQADRDFPWRKEFIKEEEMRI